MIDKLVEQIQKKQAPIVVGLDPTEKLIPDYIIQNKIGEFGETLEAMGEAIWEYNKGIIDAVYEYIPAVKPQIAMYERYGIPGLIAFRRTVEYCKDKGLVVIGDVKRGDIGSTSAAYADAHLGSVKVGSKTYKPFDSLR